MLKRIFGILLFCGCISQGIMAYAQEESTELILPADEMLQQVAPGELQVSDNVEGVGSAELKENYLLSNNEGQNDYYWNWAEVICSHLTMHENGSFTRVEYISGGNIYIEDYSENFELTGHKKLSAELPLFGGFYNDGTYYYLVFGQTNHGENNSTEVYRIVKYSHDWQRLGAASVKGANTTVPFNAGSLRFDDYGGYLYIRTCHEMYTAADGYNHQANVTMKIKIEDMSISDIAYMVQNSSVGYVSHSFNQFIKVDNGVVYALDHGDAHPRTAVLFKYDNTAFGGWDCSTTRVDTMTYADYENYHYNYTGGTLGGFEVSDYACITAGSSTPQDGVNHYMNIYVTATDKNDFSEEGTKIRWITNNTNTSANIDNPQLVEIDKNNYLLLWTEGGDWERELNYLRLDGRGNLIGNIVSCEGFLSDCQPIYDSIEERIVWYVTDGYDLAFYSIDVNTWKLEKKYVIKSLRDIKVSVEDITINIGEKTDLDVSYVPMDTTDDKTVSWESEDTSIATVDQNGVVTAVDAGGVYITATVGDYTRYAYVRVEKPLEKIEIDKRNLTVTKGYFDFLSITKIPADTTDYRSPEWWSDDESIVKITNGGYLEGVGKGTTTVHAKIGDITDSVQVKVKIPIEAIDLNKEVLNLKKGETANLNVTCTPAEAKEDAVIKWESANPSVATVTSDGKVKAVDEGYTYIMVTVDDSYWVYCSVYVRKPTSTNPSASPAPTMPPVQSWPFADVEMRSGHWKYENVKFVYERGIMNGVGDGREFRPDDSLTRAMFATVLYRIAGEPEVTYKRIFSDVPAGKWYSNAVIWAYESGIVVGLGDGTYGVNANITREQIAKMLMEYAKVCGYYTGERAEFSNFGDAGKVSRWANEYMQWAVGSGIISGSKKGNIYYMNPKGNATRVECATMLSRFVQKYE